MTTTSFTPQRKRTSVPPRRGQIKAQIFDSFVKSVISAVSMAGESLRKLTTTGDHGGDSAYPITKFLQLQRGTTMFLNLVKCVILVIPTWSWYSYGAF